MTIDHYMLLIRLSIPLLLISSNSIADTAILDISGTSTISISQTGGDHYLDVISVDNNSGGTDITTTQQGIGNHSIDLDLTNNAGGYDVDITQNSSSDLSVSVTSTCETAAGCSVNITQQ